MAAFLWRRSLSALGLLFVVSIVSFILIQAPEGDFGTHYKTFAISQGGMTEADAQKLADQIRVRYGLDQPLYLQYLNWIGGIVTEGDFGQSFTYNKPVADLIGERLWRTLGIALTCHLLATLIGVSLGIYAAVNQHRLGDTASTVLAFLGMTIPRYFMALLILYWLAFIVGSPYIGSLFSPRYVLAPWSLAKFWDLLLHIWPIILIATVGGLAYNLRVMRCNLLDVLRQPFIETAREGAAGEESDPQTRRTQRAAPARHVSGRHPALYADRRAGGGDRPERADHRPADARHIGTPGRVRNGDDILVALPGADHRQLHRRSASGSTRSANSHGRSGMSTQPIADARAGLLADDAAPAVQTTRSQTYLNLVWRRFRKNRVGMTGGVLVALLLLTTIFADFLAPYDPAQRDRDNIYTPPANLHFVSDEGFHPIPFAHPVAVTLNPQTFELVFTEDTGVRCRPEFLGKGWNCTLFGIPMNRHLLAASLECPWHILGTDRDGRDMLSRVLIRSQLTLIMAGLVVAIAVTIDTLFGIVSGYNGGTVDHWLQRGVEFILALPELPFYFALVAIIPRNAEPLHVFFMLAAILSLLKWAQLAREVRGKTLSISQLDYVTAAEAVGAGTPRIVMRHILPNVMSHVVVVTTLMIPIVVLIESFLSFLGLGVQPPLVSWGMLLNAGKDLQNLGSYPWVLTPVVATLITVLSFNMLGDGLRDAVDPYQH